MCERDSRWFGQVTLLQLSCLTVTSFFLVLKLRFHILSCLTIKCFYHERILSPSCTAWQSELAIKLRMSGKKRQQPPVAAVVEDEEAFPRGGARDDDLTPLERRKLSLQAEADYRHEQEAEAAAGGEAPSKKKQKRTNDQARHAADTGCQVCYSSRARGSSSSSSSNRHKASAGSLKQQQRGCQHASMLLTPFTSLWDLLVPSAAGSGLLPTLADISSSTEGGYQTVMVVCRNQTVMFDYRRRQLGCPDPQIHCLMASRTSKL